ncbi:MAG: NAD(+)/NADH kinase [Candidatus Omnitrophota bacterium]|jgi:NAD+ kinase
MGTRRAAKKIGIVANPHKRNAGRLLTSLRRWLGRRGIAVVDTDRQSLEQTLKGSSLVICLGGDGTLLNLSRHVASRSIPILGVNMGSLGFLTEVKEQEVFQELDQFLKGDYVLEDRLMLSCTVRNGIGRREHLLTALNDIVISREGLSRLLRLDVRVGAERLTSFAGDGIIISTPTGSTAYSLSAGGAIVHPKVEALVVTPICPHASALRCLVVDQNEKMVVRILSTHGSAKALLTADGQENVEIDDSYNVEITRSEKKLKLVKSSKRSYFATLRENFKFPE